MEMYANAINKLGGSILHNDFFILLFAIVELFFFLVATSMANSIKKRREGWKEKQNKPFSSFLLKGVSVFYSIFTTIITIFPLLGMFGTVCGLLGLGIDAGDIENIKNNFFVALTSTAWGIIFSIIYKILNSLFSDNIEEQIAFAKKYTIDNG